MTAYETLYKARLAVTKMNAASIFSQHSLGACDVGNEWAWRILYNAELHLEGIEVKLRSDMGLLFGDTVAYGHELLRNGRKIEW